MAQHFLLSAKARTLSLKTIYRMDEDQAYEAFCAIRWHGTDGEAVCPRCGCVDSYKITTRRKHKCKACHHQFSVTSGTIFASRKMEFVDLLAAICLFVNSVKGISALQLSRDLDCQYKTAFVLSHKIREAMASEVHTGEQLEDHVEVDGAYFGGHIRPANYVENRVDRRLKKYQTGKRRVVVVLRERTGRTLPFVTLSEADGVALAKKHVSRDATMSADEATHWDVLHARWKTDRINHSKAYSHNGACTNQAESFFSRLRRMVSGQHHFVSPKYLHQYANNAAWLEDNRRNSNGENAHGLLECALLSPVSRQWKGYWQRAVV